MATANDMRGQILDVAQGLVQTRGYEGFSYADIAERVGIRKASIHHYFPTKSDLGVHLVERFRKDCHSRLDSLKDADPTVRLLGYVGLFRETLQSSRMCLCGILAAGFANLTDEVRHVLLSALSDQEDWIIGVLRDGQSEGLFRGDLPPDTLARNFIGGLEGALLLARVHDDPGRFEAAVVGLIESLGARPESG